MSLFSRIAKKLRRRKRKKSTRFMNVAATMTAAEKLIQSNWGLSFKNIQAARAGTSRRMKREHDKWKANQLIPSGDRMTRQRLRAQVRKMDKMSSQRIG